jgi:catechol 2,3-dioxygenase-like lactoylglutathione lyase family enzyme
MKPKISMITLGVSDLTKSTAFYRDGLGLPTYGDYPGVIFFKLTGTWLALFPYDDLVAEVQLPPSKGGFSGFTLAHNVASTNEVDDLIKQAEQAGAKIIKFPEKAEWGGYAGCFSDPDGYIWEVAWNPDFDLT